MMQGDSKKAAKVAWGLGLLVAVLALTGCGGSSSPVTSVIDLKSKEVHSDGTLDPSVRCGWGSLWIPLEWGEVPDGTKELAILLGRYQYVKENGKRKAVVKFADLVSKFRPTEHRLVANVLPSGVSWSSFGINCVTQSKGQHILLEVFALDQIRHRTMNPRLATRLTEEALADPHPTEGPRSPGDLTADAAAVGRLFTTFTGPHY